MRTNGTIIGVLGMWLIIAGLIGLGQLGNIWNGWIIGVIVAVLGFDMVERTRAHGIICGILGLWMIASAYIARFTAGRGARWDDIIVGILMVIFGFSTPRRVTEVASDTRRAA